MGSMKGPWSTADVEGLGIAFPFARCAPLTEGDASGCSGRTSGEGLEGDKLHLLSSGLVAVRALLDLLGAAEMECKFRLGSFSYTGESLSLKDPREGRGREGAASDQIWDTRFETLPTTEWAERMDSRAALRR